jgi:WD40 repeat protein
MLSIVTASFSPDGQVLVTGSLSGHLVEWDGRTGEKGRVLLDPKGREDDNPRVEYVENGVEVEPPFQIARLSEEMRGSSILSLCFSPDGGTFAVGAANGVVVLWNAESRGEVWFWIDHDGRHSVDALAISPDSHWLAVGSEADGIDSLRVFRFRSEAPFDVAEAFTCDRHVCGVSSLCFSPDSRFLVAGGFMLSGYTGPFVYELEAGKRIGSLLYDMTRSLAYSPDGRLIATGDDFGTLKLWDAAARTQLFEATAHATQVGVLLFSPDGRRLATGGRDGSVSVWDVETRKLLVEHRCDDAVVAFHFSGSGGDLSVATAADDTPAPEVHVVGIGVAGY